MAPVGPAGKASVETTGSIPSAYSGLRSPHADPVGRGGDPAVAIVSPPTHATQLGVRCHHGHYLVLKRVTDLLVALFALLVTWPVFLIIALLIKVSSAGPALFVQTRIGKDGRPFGMYKFRTMRHRLDDADHRAFMQAFVRGEIHSREPSRALYKPFDGSQLTRIGRLLRRSSLDELPQLLNVLKGEMSLVGPRPNVPWEVAAYKAWHTERLAVLPGMTGLAQINGRSSIVFDTIVEYDIAYVRNQHLWLDLNILWRTLATVRKPHGAM